MFQLIRCTENKAVIVTASVVAVVVIISIAVVSNYVIPSMKANPTTNQATQVKRKEITVTDALGRKVTLPYPVTRAIVTDDEVAELVQLVGAANRVVGISPSVKWRGYFPQMADKPVTGNQFRGLNYELIMKLKPDVVIMMNVGPIGKIIQKLNKLGIEYITISIDPATTCFQFILV